MTFIIINSFKIKLSFNNSCYLIKVRKTKLHKPKTYILEGVAYNEANYNKFILKFSIWSSVMPIS